MDEIETEESEYPEFLNKLIDKLKSMSKADWTHTLVAYLMIIMLCVAFYALGYGKAYQNTVEVANEIIIELIDQNPGIDKYNSIMVNIDGFMFNNTSQELIKTGG